MWVEHVPSFLGAVRDFSLTFSCAYHCGQSVLVPWFIGLLSGIFVGICLALLFLIFLRAHFSVPHPDVSAAPDRVSQQLRRRSSRLGQYLYE